MLGNVFWMASLVSIVIFIAGVGKRIKTFTRKERVSFLYTVAQASGTTATITGSILFISLWFGPGYYPTTIIGGLKTIDALITVTVILGSLSLTGLLHWLWRGMPRANVI